MVWMSAAFCRCNFDVLCNQCAILRFSYHKTLTFFSDGRLRAVWVLLILSICKLSVSTKPITLSLKTLVMVMGIKHLNFQLEQDLSLILVVVSF